MSAAPSEPEKYSIDEMMERLKSASSETPDSGELVTRADGSQAIRVRKRKRRSSQPHKQEAKQSQRVRVIQVAAALIVLFLAILGVGGGLIFANSSPFRESLLTKISESTGAEARLMTFRMNPKTANAGGLDLKWPEGNALDSLTLRGVEAGVSPVSFFGKSFKGDELTVTEGALALKTPQIGKPLRSIPSGNEPLRVQFERYQIRALNLTVGDPVAPPLRLTRSEASMALKPATGASQLRLYRGELTVPGWPKLRLDRALLEFQDEDTKILQLRVLHETDDRGQLDFSGTTSPYPPDRLSKLAVALDSFQLSGLLGTAFGRLVSGRVSTQSAEDSNFLSFSPGGSLSPVFDVAFTKSTGSSINLQGFPFLFGLAQHIEDDWYERPNFENDEGGFIHRENGVVTVRNLDLENKGKLAVKGTLVMAADGSLSGTLQIGITDALIQTAKGSAFRDVFGAEQNAYRWVTVKIGGTVNTPSDNFKDLLAAAGSKAPSSPDAKEPHRSSFEELTRPR